MMAQWLDGAQGYRNHERQGQDKTTWVTIAAERVLYVDRGREVILCDRQATPEIVVQLSSEALASLRKQINGQGPSQPIGANPTEHEEAPTCAR